MKKKGIKMFAIVLTIFIVLLICIFPYLFLNGYSGLHIRKDAQENQIKVACVGDSITYGHGISNWHKNNYPAVLQTILGDKYNVQNFGVSGATVQKTADKPYEETNSYVPSIEYNADVLIFMLGTNDSKPYNWHGTESFKKQYLELLDTYITDDNKSDIYLCTVAKVFYDYESQESGPSNFDIQGDKVEEINKIIKEIAAERGYKYIDIYELTSQHPEWFAKDNIHPNADGAKAIANKMYEHVKDFDIETGNIDVENQIKLIAKEFDEWNIEYTDVYKDYCVTDLNRNGLLEIIASYNQGTGLYSLNKIFEVNEEVNDLIEYKIDDESETQPDLLFSNSVNCYNKDNRYCYIFNDNIKVSATEHWTFVFAVSLENNQFNCNLITREEILWSDNENYTAIYKNSNDETITETEFKIAEKEYFNDYKHETVKLGWCKDSINDNSSLLNKTNEELITILTQSYNTFIGN